MNDNKDISNNWTSNWSHFYENATQAFGMSPADPSHVHHPEEILKTYQNFYQNVLEKSQASPFLGIQSLLEQQNIWIQSLTPESLTSAPTQWENINTHFEQIRAHITSMNDQTPCDQKTRQKINYYNNLLFDFMSPRHNPLLNPEITEATYLEKGENLRRGFENFQKDQSQFTHISMPSMAHPDDFHIGRDLATTPGCIVFENGLIQLIHYTPQQTNELATPLLIVPPWINKYYIFDLTPTSSFVQWMLGHGIPVYMVSWVNPTLEHAHLNLEDYVFTGVHEALKAVQIQHNTTQVHTMGYCVGGVALLMLNSYLAAQKSDVISSCTLLATPIDFSQMHELSIFVGQDQIKHLQSYIAQNPILSGEHFLAMFALLRARDLIWKNVVNHYFLGKPHKKNPFLFWNSDFTNIPGLMHIDYLTLFFQKNAWMKKNGFKIRDQQVNLKNVQTPTYVLAAKNDHIVPPAASYAAVKRMPKAQFVLCESGHVAGVMNHPGTGKYGYQTPDGIQHAGSWWGHWGAFIKQINPRIQKARHTKKTSMLEVAPGRYVQK